QPARRFPGEVRHELLSRRPLRRAALPLLVRVYPPARRPVRRRAAADDRRAAGNFEAAAEEGGAPRRGARPAGGAGRGRPRRPAAQDAPAQRAAGLPAGLRGAAEVLRRAAAEEGGGGRRRGAAGRPPRRIPVPRAGSRGSRRRGRRSTPGLSAQRVVFRVLRRLRHLRTRDGPRRGRRVGVRRRSGHAGQPVLGRRRRLAPRDRRPRSV
ncbi:MAG: hypothetical protein BJ554DRAFT_2504, partial [Olpidium bornovanus]